MDNAGGRTLRILFACGTLARDELPRLLRASGHHVDEVVVYETRLLEPSEGMRSQITRGVDAILLASPSAAKALARSGMDLGRALVGCIGSSTASAAEREGLRVGFVSEEHSDRGLVDALVAHLGTQEHIA
jgi:uroporphyrinogen-III synthase